MTDTFTVQVYDPSADERFTVEGVEDAETQWGDMNEVVCRFPDDNPRRWVATGLTIERVTAEHNSDQ